MDIWETLYEKARGEYHPEDVTPFIHLCAERTAALNMYMNSGQTQIRRLIAFRDRPPFGGESGMPCGACREFLMQLDPRNRDLEILVDYESRQTVTLGELMPAWWGESRYRASAEPPSE